MEVNKKQLADIFGASIRTIQNWQDGNARFSGVVARVMKCFMTLPPP